MKYYIGTNNGSGIEAKDFDSFMAYMREIAERAEKQGQEWLDVNVDVELRGED